MDDFHLGTQNQRGREKTMNAGAHFGILVLLIHILILAKIILIYMNRA